MDRAVPTHRKTNFPKRVGFLAAIAFLEVILVRFLVEAFPQTLPQNDPFVVITAPHGVTIRAELADTLPKRVKGLMFRESLPANHGMLFTFSEEQEWSFWMKNTRMSLDIIWIDKTKKIVHVERNVPICTRTDDGCPNYQPVSPALYVLELAAGTAEALKLQRGVRLKFDAPPAQQ